MDIKLSEVKLYENFDELAEDVLTLAKEVLPDKFIYINYLGNSKQVTLKVSEEDSDINLSEGQTIDLKKGLCNTLDFENKNPLVYENVDKATDIDYLKKTLEDANIEAYLGIPITLHNNERFGTLCTADSSPTKFDQKSIDLLQRIAKMFSYYLEMERLAYRDALTDLYNRLYLYKHFERFDHPKGVLYFLDLDGFKKVNDTYGHEVGDDVLVETANKLTTLFSDLDSVTAVRLGGDEFVVHVPGEYDKTKVESRSERLLEDFRSWESVKDSALSASLGVLRYSEHLPLKRLLKTADTALYHAKEKGRNAYVLADTPK